MTRRERVIAALTGAQPDRVPRAYTAVPGFNTEFPGALARIEARFPQDVVDNGYRLPPGQTKGDPYGVGEYVDEWGCVFHNVHPGVIGQVKDPMIASWNDLDHLRPPERLLKEGYDNVARTCAATDGFTFSGLPLQPFERMQFLRGTETLFMDLAEMSAEFERLKALVHEFNLAYLERWCQLPVDCVFLADDWGTQRGLLISPEMWRETFKPLYADYIRRAKQAGKFVYMHSDGMIIEIIEDLIALGLDAINAQVTCMDMAELHRRFAGRITFWGQMDRQHMLCFGTVEEANQHVRDFWHHLRGPNGDHVVCQMHIEPSARPANIEAVLSGFERVL